MFRHTPGGVEEKDNRKPMVNEKEKIVEKENLAFCEICGAQKLPKSSFVSRGSTAFEIF